MPRLLERMPPPFDVPHPVCSPCLLCFGNTLKPFKSLLDAPGNATSMSVSQELLGPDRDLGCCLGVPELENLPVLLNLTIMPRLTTVFAAATSPTDHI